MSQPSLVNEFQNLSLADLSPEETRLQELSREEQNLEKSLETFSLYDELFTKALSQCEEAFLIEFCKLCEETGMPELAGIPDKIGDLFQERVQFLHNKQREKTEADADAAREQCRIARHRLEYAIKRAAES